MDFETDSMSAWVESWAVMASCALSILSFQLELPSKPGSAECSIATTFPPCRTRFPRGFNHQLVIAVRRCGDDTGCVDLSEHRLSPGEALRFRLYAEAGLNDVLPAIFDLFSSVFRK
jgi:hypothetical protein